MTVEFQVVALKRSKAVIVEED